MQFQSTHQSVRGSSRSKSADSKPNKKLDEQKKLKEIKQNTPFIQQQTIQQPMTNPYHIANQVSYVNVADKQDITAFDQTSLVQEVVVSPYSEMILMGGGWQYFKRFLMKMDKKAYFNFMDRSSFHYAFLNQRNENPVYDKRFYDSYEKYAPKDMPLEIQKDPSKLFSIVSDMHEEALVKSKGKPDGYPIFERAQSVFEILKKGHYASLRKVYQMPDAKNHINDYQLTKRMISMFPGGSYILDKEMADAYLKATDKKAFFKENESRIKDKSDKFFQSKEPLTGQYALLGPGNLVYCSNHQIYTNEKGQIIQTAVMGTTGRHALDGTVPWTHVWDPKNPDKLTGMSIHFGEHPIRGMDYNNQFLGLHLFSTLFDGIPHTLKYDAPQNHTAEIAKNFPYKTQFKYHVLSLMNKAYFPAFAREMFGPNFESNKEAILITEKDIEKSDFIETFNDRKGDLTKEASGILVDGKEISYDLDPLTGRPYLGSIASVMLEKKIDNLSQLQFSEKNQDAFFDKVSKICQDNFSPEELKTLSFQDLQDRLKDNFDFERLAYEHFFSPIEGQLQNELSKSLKDLELFQAKIVLKEYLSKNHFEPFIAKGGFVDIVVQKNVFEAQGKVVDTKSIQATIDQINQRVSNYDMQRLEYQRKLEILRKEDPNNKDIEKLEREIQDVQEKFEKEANERDKWNETKEAFEDSDRAKERARELEKRERERKEQIKEINKRI